MTPVFTRTTIAIKRLKISSLLFTTLFFAVNAFSAPVISSFSPASGPVGTSVVITGSGFSATAAQNVVFFGATKAAVTAASASSITVTVPGGSTYEKITVTNLAVAQTGFSAKPFIVTLNGSGLFKPKQDLSTGSIPYSSRNTDIDGDGKPDIVVANQSGNSVSVIRNTSVAGVGSFAAKLDFATASSPYTVAVGDIDGDGKPDLVVACFFNQKVSVFRNTSTPASISFDTRVDLTSGFCTSVAIADYDGDGKPDLAAACHSPNNVLVFRNTSPAAGSVSFAAGLSFTPGASPLCIASGDIDGDGKVDLVTANSDGGTISVLRNGSSPGSINFAPKTDAATGTDPRYCIVGDFDNDGKMDIASANYGSGTVSILRNVSSSGSVTFGVKTDLTTPSSPRCLDMGDINGDGKPDIAIGVNDLQVVTFKNISVAGTINLTEQINTGTGGNSISVTIGDLDGDAKPDLCVTNANASNISFLSQASKSPAITSFSPLSGIVGSSVVITGTAFNTTPSQNIVFFGATKATVTAATATSLTVTVPFGSTYQLISVTNLATSLTAFSDKVFNVTLAGGTAFNPKQDFAVGLNPQSLTSGDLDGDGKPDLAMVNGSASPVTVIRNTSSGGVVSFAPKQDFGSGTQVKTVTIGDLDGDGKPDLAVSSWGSSTVDIYRNTSVPGNISFAAPVGFYAFNFPQSVDIDDLDGDGKPDLAVACGMDRVVILRNISSPGTILFDPEIEISTPNYSEAVSLADIDGDGKPDLAVTNDASGNMSLLRNTSYPGNIRFATRIDFVTGLNPGKVVVADIDGDGKFDVSVTGRTNYIVSVFRNTSTPGVLSLAPKVDFTTPNNPNSLSIGDVDGDGKPDLATANYYSASASLLKNTSSPGTISFAPRIDWATTVNPESVVIGDIDADGKPDLSVLSYVGTLSVFKQYAVIPPPTITAISPASGAVGSSVVISGTNFNTTAVNNIVFFGATRATVTAATANSLTVTVPLGSTYQVISATNLASNLTAFSDKIFNVTLAGATNFNPKQDLDIGPLRFSLAMGDLDSDGKPDFAMLNYSATPITVIRNTSTAGVISFAPRQDFGSGTSLQMVRIGDLDGDGKPDLAVSGETSRTVDIYRNTSVPGTISFAGPVSFGVSLYPKQIAIDDIDGDGKPDLAVASGPNRVVVLRNLSSAGNILFDTKMEFATIDYSSSVGLGDIDGDGKPDMVVTNNVGGSLSLFRNTSIPGNISFAARVDLPTGASPGMLLIADIDGDGKSDVSVSIGGADLISVFRNVSTPGTINMAPKIDFATPDQPAGFDIGDVDGDGKPDLATTNFYATSASLLKNTSSPGNISFATRIDLVAPFNPGSVAIGDIDGDGKPDLTVLSVRDILSVLRQKVIVPPPTGNPSQSFCASISPKVSDLAATGTAIKWYSAGNVLLEAATPLANATTYYASQTVNGNESEQRLAVTVTINAAGTNITWLGVTNNWHSTANWSNATVPNTCMNVIVNSGAGIVMPVVTGLTGACNKLTLNNGATITIAAGAKLLIVSQ
ncbi:MAG: FG-GAP-like repeat-containing protein [Bacteroidota bacterium]